MFYLMPIWASIFAVILIKEKPTFTSIIAIAIATAGAFLILIYDQWGTTFVLVESLLSIAKEDFLAIVGGIFFGLGNVLIRKTIGITSLLKTFAIFFGTFLVAAVFLLINHVLYSTGKFAKPSPITKEKKTTKNLTSVNSSGFTVLRVINFPFE